MGDRGQATSGRETCQQQDRRNGCISEASAARGRGETVPHSFSLLDTFSFFHNRCKYAAMKYEVQKRIHTLNENAVMASGTAASFTELDINFSHWDFNYRDGWLHNYWLANGQIEASNAEEASTQFHSKLTRIIPRIALIGQCYIESVLEPFVVLRADSELAWFRYTRDMKGVPLMFGDPELKALRHLLKNSEISEAFYYYWNDAVNTIGYSPKLLLLFSALEALFKPEREKGKDHYYAVIETVLGGDLKTELYGTKENPGFGLRQRLVHGEYLEADDTQRNCVELIHKKLVEYFNTYIFKEKLIEEHVVHPHRHFFGNKEGCAFFVKSNASRKVELKALLSDIEKHGIDSMKLHKHIYDEELAKTF